MERICAMMAQRLEGVSSRIGINIHLDLRILHQHVRAQDARLEDGTGRLCSAVCSAKGGEDDGDCTTHGAKEGLDFVRCRPLKCELIHTAYMGLMRALY